MDGQWYSYDDSSVDLIPEEEVCTRGAYILFYERRNAIPPWSASCSVRGKVRIFDALLSPGLSCRENSAVLSANCSFSRCWLHVLTLQYLPVVPQNSGVLSNLMVMDSSLPRRFHKFLDVRSLAHSTDGRQ